MVNKDKMLDELYERCFEQIHPKKDSLDLDYLEESLNETMSGCEIRIEEDSEDPYKLNVSLSLPYFVPAVDVDTGELWYICTREGVDLKYTIKDDKYIFQSRDKELLEFLLSDCEGFKMDCENIDVGGVNLDGK